MALGYEHSTTQGLPFIEESIMNINCGIFFNANYQTRSTNPQVSSSSKIKYCANDSLPVHCLDYLHINLLYCGGMMMEFCATLLRIVYLHSWNIMLNYGIVVFFSFLVINHTQLNISHTLRVTSFLPSLFLSSLPPSSSLPSSDNYLMLTSLSTLTLL